MVGGGWRRAAGWSAGRLRVLVCACWLFVLVVVWRRLMTVLRSWVCRVCCCVVGSRVYVGGLLVVDGGGLLVVVYGCWLRWLCLGVLMVVVCLAMCATVVRWHCVLLQGVCLVQVPLCATSRIGGSCVRMRVCGARGALVDTYCSHCDAAQQRWDQHAGNALSVGCVGQQ